MGGSVLSALRGSWSGSSKKGEKREWDWEEVLLVSLREVAFPREPGWSDVNEVVAELAVMHSW